MKRTVLLFLIIYVSINCVKAISLKVDKDGKGKPILFLPGFTCPGEVWNETISNLGEDYESIKFTYPGFAHVEPISIPWYKTIVEDLKSYILENNLKDFIIVGHSMGGMLAMEIAAEFPDLVDKMILVDALPCIRQVMMPNVSEENITFDNPYNNNMIQMPDSVFQKTAYFMAQGMTNDQSKVGLLTQWIIDSDRETYVYGYTELLKLDLRDELEKIKAKTLILSADFIDKEVVLNNLKEQYGKLENKEIKIANSSKHFIMFDQQEWFVNELSEFLK